MESGSQESFLKSVQYLNELEDKQTGLEYLETMFRYIFSAGKDLTEAEVNQIIRQLETTYPEGSEVAMTMADKWREEGWEKGLERGLEKGKVEALSEMAMQLLEEKFGEVPQDIKDGILKSDIVALKLLLANIFRYESVDDVRKYI